MPRSDAVGDRVGERHHDDGQERRDRDLVVAPVDRADLGHHQEADDDQRRGRGLERDDRDQRREEHGQQEQDAGHDRGEAGARAFADARRALDVAGVARDGRPPPTAAAAESTSRIDSRCGMFPSSSISSASGPARDHRAHGVEEVREQQGEHEQRRGDEPTALNAPNSVELAEEHRSGVLIHVSGKRGTSTATRPGCWGCPGCRRCSGPISARLRGGSPVRS